MIIVKTKETDGTKSAHAIHRDSEFTLCGIAFDSTDSNEGIEWEIDESKTFPENLVWEGKKITCRQCIDIIKHVKDNY